MVGCASLSGGIVLSVVVALIATFFFASAPIRAVPYSLPPPIDIPPNDRLRNASRLLEDAVYGPESIAIREDGHVYTGLKTGLIVELDEDLTRVLRAVRLTSAEECDGSYRSFPRCGRPLGLRWTKNGLLVADAYLGLFRIDFEKEEVETLVRGGSLLDDPSDAVPMRYINDVDELPDGRIVLSESSSVFDDRDFLYDLLEHRPNGRILVFNPRNGRLSVLVQDLFFPNGVQVWEGEILISEMANSRILRYSPSLGSLSVLVDALPGYPDNIRLSRDGRSLWIPIAAIRSEDDNWLAARPALREMLTKVFSYAALELIIEAVSSRNGLVLRYDLSGDRVAESWQDPGGEVVRDVSVAVEDGHGRLVMGSDSHAYLARIKL